MHICALGLLLSDFLNFKPNSKYITRYCSKSDEYKISCVICMVSDPMLLYKVGGNCHIDDLRTNTIYVETNFDLTSSKWGEVLGKGLMI